MDVKLFDIPTNEPYNPASNRGSRRDLAGGDWPLERALSGLLLAGFILLPGAFLYAFFQGTRACCHQLSDRKFFEPMRDSVAIYVLVLLTGLWIVNLLETIRFHQLIR